ncbi:hypothetical protein EZV62_025316 [Acer yangbiense]|uniref:PARP catalytic domain-containing protein n=1 Tax=Acer yangbiense TaxID=1000413 RepID=A0A5C7GXY8_9ROSI|nr:hypothetical protein EZV62_025316 [Acer yangbiense]
MRLPLVSKNLIKYSSLDNPSEKANSTYSELNSETHDQDSSSMSDCESSISGSCEDWFRVWWVEHKLRLLPFIGIHFVVMGQARTQSFQIFEKAMANKCGGNSNLKFAWHAGSKQELCKIVEQGFRKPKDNGFLKDSVVDEDGMRHLLLCCLILGKTEAVHPGSDQYHPSSEEFDSGVDNLTMPKHKV